MLTTLVENINLTSPAPKIDPPYETTSNNGLSKFIEGNLFHNLVDVRINIRKNFQNL